MDSQGFLLKNGQRHWNVSHPLTFIVHRCSFLGWKKGWWNQLYNEQKMKLVDSCAVLQDWDIYGLLALAFTALQPYSPTVLHEFTCLQGICSQCGTNQPAFIRPGRFSKAVLKKSTGQLVHFWSKVWRLHNTQKKWCRKHAQQLSHEPSHQVAPIKYIGWKKRNRAGFEDSAFKKVTKKCIKRPNLNMTCQIVLIYNFGLYLIPAYFCKKRRCRRRLWKSSSRSFKV